MEFTEATNTPILGGKAVNNAYLLILITGGMENSREKWEDMQVGLKNWQAFKDHFFNPTGSTRSARKQQLLPMDMVRQKSIHRKQSPR